MKIGDKVMWTKKFLKSIGVMTGELPFDVGTIENIVDYKQFQVAHVRWASAPEITRSARTSNLVLKTKLCMDAD